MMSCERCESLTHELNCATVDRAALSVACGHTEAWMEELAATLGVEQPWCPNITEAVERLMREHGKPTDEADPNGSTHARLRYWKDCNDVLNDENERLTRERDEARRNYQFMVDRAINEKLDGYRELGRKAADAENGLDAEREAHARTKAELDRAHMASTDGVMWRKRADRVGADAAALRAVLDGIEAWLHDVRGMNISPGWAEIYGGVLAKLDRLCAEHGVRMGGTSESR